MESSVATRIEELKAGKTTKAQRAMMDFLSRTDGTSVLKMSISEIAFRNLKFVWRRIFREE